MKSKAQQLRDKFEEELAKLQADCLHENITEMPYSYAPGHFAGMVNVCDECDKIIKK